MGRRRASGRRDHSEEGIVKKHKSTADLMLAEAIRRGWKPLIIDGQPVQPPKGKKTPKPNGKNGSKK